MKGQLSTGSNKVTQIALSITLNGPMLIDFASASNVDVYVPFCPFHEAGFFFTRGSFSETDLWKCALSSGVQPDLSARRYNISGSGIGSPGSGPSFLPFDRPPGLSPKTITPPESRRSKQAGNANYGYVLQLAPAAKRRSLRHRSANAYPKRMFQISVPMPMFVTPLYYDSVEVRAGYSKSGSNGSLNPHCTGIRFFYGWDPKTYIQLSFAGGGICDITPPSFDSVPSIPDIEIRYSGVEIADENDPHSDSRSCFASLAAMAGVDWWVDYHDGMCSPTNPSQSSGILADTPDPCANTSMGSVKFHTGGDCHAPVVVNGFD